MKSELKVTRQHDGRYIVTVDGGNIECGTTAEVMSRVGHEMGMPFNKAQRQLFERMEAAEKVTRDLEAENDLLFRANTELSAENVTLKAAIVKCFVKTFGKEG